MNAVTREIYNICAELQHKNLKIESSLQPRLLNEIINIAIDCTEKPEDYNPEIVETSSAQYDSICLTSGGADSTIAWYLNDKPHGLYIDIGQPYLDRELEVLKYHNIEYDFVPLNGLFHATWKHTIPARNLLFLTVAASLLKDDGEIYFGVVNGEGFESGKGDHALTFLEKFLDWYFDMTGKCINITTFDEQTKAGWLKVFQQKGFDINLIRHHTVTCFSGGVGKQCGECVACLRKYLSFISAFRLDTFEDYLVHPMIGCKDYIDIYRIKLQKCIDEQDFSHYSATRCNEDLDAIAKVHIL